MLRSGDLIKLSSEQYLRSVNNMPILENFYDGQTILVTGGTGFMGKVLVEKIVRCLPGVKKIYLFMRKKKGLTPTQRLNALVNTVPFTLNNIDPEAFNKLVVINGDTTEDNLGLSEEDKHILITEVTVVFHFAAALRMDLHLKDAVLQNVLGSRKVLALCSEMKQLLSVVHLSTAFCNVDIEFMEEKVYPLDVDPDKIIDLVQWMDEDCLNKIEMSLIKPHPNTYTFTKRLTEVMISKIGTKLPIVIARPSIVIPAVSEPAPGWVDNYNGPVGMMVAGGKGILRNILMDKSSIPQIIPVDIAINALITCGWARATLTFNETPVYNLTQSKILSVSWGEAIEKFREISLNYPYKKMFWYPNADITTSFLLNYINILFFHTIPFYTLDFLILLCFQKPFLVNIFKRIQMGSHLLQYFALRKWTFDNNLLLEIEKNLTAEDLEVFYISNTEKNVDKYIQDAYFGSRKYLLKEDMDHLTLYKFQMRVLYTIDRFLKLSFLYFLVKFVFYVFDISWNALGF